MKILERMYIWGPFDCDFQQCYLSQFSDIYGYWESFGDRAHQQSQLLRRAGLCCTCPDSCCLWSRFDQQVSKHCWGAGFHPPLFAVGEIGIWKSEGNSISWRPAEEGLIFFLFAHNKHHRLQGARSFCPLQLCQSALRPLLGHSCDPKSCFRTHYPAPYASLCCQGSSAAEQV